MTLARFGLALSLVAAAVLSVASITVLWPEPVPVSADHADTPYDADCANDTVVPGYATKSGLVADCDNLLRAAYYWDTNTHNSRRGLNWADTRSIYTWEGVTVETVEIDGANVERVTELDLNSNGRSLMLRGRIPPELGNLLALRSLDLGWNYLGGDIPSNFWKLTELRTINLESNSFSGTLPGGAGSPGEDDYTPGLKHLTNLTELNINANSLSGLLPAEIGQLTELRELVLQSNGFTGPIPPEIGELTNLSKIYLHINNFSGPIPDLSKLTHLKSLVLYGNQLTGDLPSWLPELTLLERIHLYSNQLTGTIPDLSPLTNLTDLNLHNNQFTGSIPESLEDLPLTDLKLSENNFTGCIPSALFDIPRHDLQYVNSYGGYYDSETQMYAPAQLLRRCDAPQVVVTFEQSSYTVAEGSRVTVRVILSAEPEDNVTVPLTVTNQGGALSGDDYEELPGSVVFEFDETSKELTFRAYSDDDNDDGESVKLSFGTPTHNITVGAPGETTITITDDDVPSVEVSFESSTYSVAEGSSETVKVKLSADPERTVTIPIDASSQDGALSPDDYTGVPESVVFNSGQTEQTFTFNATQDTVVDRDESVDLGFGSQLPEGVTEDAQNATTTVSITDDDDPQVTVSFEQGAYAVDEGSSVDVMVRLSDDPLRTVDISVTAAGQGGADSNDYSGVPTTVTFNSGDTEKVVAFSAMQDTEDDEGKSVNLGLTGLPAGVTVTQDPTEAGETVVSINDDDDPEVSFASNAYTVVEGNSVTVTVKLSSAADQSLTIPVRVADAGSASSDDYSGVPIEVTFTAGDTEETFTFGATADDEGSEGESVKLGFDTLPSGVAEGSPNETTVSITEPAPPIDTGTPPSTPAPPPSTPATPPSTPSTP